MEHHIETESRIARARVEGLGRRVRILVALLALALGLRIAFFHGFSPHLDMGYEPFAWKMAQGTWAEARHGPTGRWAIVVPTALAYRLLGVNEVSSVLWPMLTSLGTVVIAYLLASHWANERAGILASLFVAVFPFEIAFASQLMADGPLSFWLLLALYGFIRGDSDPSPGGARFWFLLCGLTLGMAYGTKLEALLVLPFFALIALMRRRIDLRVLWVAVGLSAVIAVEALLSYACWGDPLQRLTIISQERASETQQAAWDLGSTALAKMYSIGAYFRWMFVEIHYVGAAFIVLAVGYVFLALRKARGTGLRTVRCEPMLLWAGVILFILTFYPLSIRPYIPIYKLEYYMLMFTAPLLVVLALVLSQLTPRLRRLGVALVVVSSLGATYLSREAHRSQVENSRVLYAFCQGHRGQPVYAISANIYTLSYLDKYAGRIESRKFPWRIVPGGVVEDLDVPRVGSRYVAVDHYYVDYYRRLGHTFEPDILSIPPHWQVRFQYQRSEHGLRRLTRGILNRLSRAGVINETVRAGITARIESWSHNRPLIVYSVGACRTQASGQR